MHQRIPVVYSFFCNGMAELYPEIVGKIIGYSAIMITCHTGYTPILLVNRQSTSTIISIYHNILVGLLRERNFKYRSARSRGKFRPGTIRKRDTITIRSRFLLSV